VTEPVAEDGAITTIVATIAVLAAISAAVILCVVVARGRGDHRRAVGAQCRRGRRVVAGLRRGYARR
jgi:hypothetical protein